jgi:hypothetical protein
MWPLWLELSPFKASVSLQDMAAAMSIPHWLRFCHGMCLGGVREKSQCRIAMLLVATFA